jgi:hypothetical protein
MKATPVPIAVRSIPRREDQAVLAAGDTEMMFYRCTCQRGRAVVGRGVNTFVPSRRRNPSVTDDQVADDQLAAVHLTPEKPAGRLEGLPDRHLAVDGLQLEAPVSGQVGTRNSRRNGCQRAHQDDQDPPHGNGKCFLPNYAAIQRKVRTFRRERSIQVSDTRSTTAAIAMPNPTHIEATP